MIMRNRRHLDYGKPDDFNIETGEWEAPQPGQRYGEFQAGVQMASRSGALNEIEFSEFVQKLQDFAEGVGGMVEVPDMLDAVARETLDYLLGTMIETPRAALIAAVVLGSGG